MLEVRGLNKTYYTKGAQPVRALVDVSVKLEQTGMVFVLGKSGSGKSTFLNVVGGLDKYDSGEIIIKGKSSREFARSDFDSYRNTYLGFIFQEYNLINEFSVGRNIALAMELQSRKATNADIENILKLVDLSGLADRSPLQISGGQRQRVAIARALIKNPEIIMADEPTGALDSATGKAIFQTLQDLAKTRLVLVVSHDREFAELYGDRIIEFSDGRIISDMIKKGDDFVEEVEDTAALNEIRQVEEIISVTKSAGLSEQHLGILTKLLAEKKAEPSRKQQKRKGVFVPTRQEMLNLHDKNSTPFKLIKSKLPQRDALKMASSSMKHKRVRLFFSIFLSVVAITLFGFSNVVGGFNVREISKSLMRDYGYQHMIVSKSLTTTDTFSFSGSQISFSDDEKQRMQDITGTSFAEFIPASVSLPVGNITPDNKVNTEYYSQYFTGMVLSDDFTGFGIDVPEVYGRFPSASNEVLISNYMAQSLMVYGMRYFNGTEEKYLEPKNINDVLSYNFRVQTNRGYVTLKIVGIINYNIKRYEDLMLHSTKDSASKTLVDELEQRKTFDICFLYGRTDLKSYFDAYSYSNYTMDYSFSQLSTASSDKGYRNYINIRGKAFGQLNTGYSTYTYLGKDGSTVMPEPKAGEVIINISHYLVAKDRMNGNYYYEDERYNISASQLQQQANNLGLFDGKINVSTYYGDLYFQNLLYEFASGEYEVIGVVSQSDAYYEDTAFGIFADEEFAQMTRETMPQSLMVYLRDQRVASQFIDSFVGEFDSGFKGILKSYEFTLPFSSNVYTVSMVFKVLGVVFFWMSIVLCVFAALLLLNFISASVNLKKKEIGILRAIGARKVDVVSIFLWEGIIIGAIVVALSALLVFGTVIVFNNLIGSLISMPFTMLVFGALTLVYMVLITFATIGIASILPTRRVAGMKPMDAIRSI